MKRSRDPAETLGCESRPDATDNTHILNPYCRITLWEEPLCSKYQHYVFLIDLNVRDKFSRPVRQQHRYLVVT